MVYTTYQLIKTMPFINQIKTHIESTYSDILDFSDINNFDKTTDNGNNIIVKKVIIIRVLNFISDFVWTFTYI